MELRVERGAPHAGTLEDVLDRGLRIAPLVDELDERGLYGLTGALASLVHPYASRASPLRAASAAACVARNTSWNDAPARSHASTTEEYSG